MSALTRSKAIVSVVTYTHRSNRPVRDRFSNIKFSIGMIPGLQSSLYESLTLQHHPDRAVTESISCEETQIEDNPRVK